MDWQGITEFIISKKLERNLQKFFSSFPHVSENGVYSPLENIEWTAGFWTGILWLAYLSTKREEFRTTILSLLPSFADRLFWGRNTDTHDLGFLYFLSCVPGWEFLQYRSSFDVALSAAERLSKRFHPRGGYIQAFGEFPSEGEETETLVIVDSLMNLPLLYWAYRRTGCKQYMHIAIRHAQTIRSLLLREDGSTYQACRFRVPEEQPVWFGTLQGYNDTSCWSRGQAWAIYGFTLSYYYTGLESFLQSALRAAEYFLSHLPQDKICYWDLAFIDGSEPRDSSAAAIAASGLFELASIVALKDKERGSFLREEALNILHNLTIYCLAPDDSNHDGFLLHATYHLPQGLGIDESCIWGDYFYLEGLLKAQGAPFSLWYYR
uniref:Glucuronyl hydrolase n=1 Tax=Candidatus Caldatribacterium saccharofermentans TaxID=1454753 RepID=A0A7V4TJM4_9BACT